MRTLTPSERRRWALLVAVFLATLGILFTWLDAFPLAILVLAAGIIWSARGRKAWLLAGMFISAWLYWSSLDRAGCSAWWRGRMVYEKLVGRLPYEAWKDVGREVLGACVTSGDPDPAVAKGIQRLETKRVEGHKWERYQSALGEFWIPAPGRELLTWLVWEITQQHDYESGTVVLRPGDTVIDCGAHIGVFTRYALRRGAGRVIAIEPDLNNMACLEANLASEIAAGRVLLVRAGAWDRETRLRFEHSDVHSGRHSFVLHAPQGVADEGVPVLPIDVMLERLRVDRVDFIKMDIEGAERHALAGALQTLKRFRPRMAICAYHLPDDPVVLPALIRSAHAGYQIRGRDIETSARRLRPKVLFYWAPEI